MKLPTKTIWCDECKLNVFDCRHLESKDAALLVPKDMPRDPGKRGLVFLAFGETAIPSYASANIAANTQITVKPRRLVVDPVVAPHFKILDIRIGRSSPFTNGHGGVGASIFPPTPAKYQPIANLDGLPIIRVGQQMVLSVCNIDGAHHSFNALVWCDYLLEEDFVERSRP